MARRIPDLQEYLRVRRVYRTQWARIFEVIDTAGERRHRVVLNDAGNDGICSCTRGRFDQKCRHLVLVIMRKGGSDGRGVRLGAG